MFRKSHVASFQGRVACHFYPLEGLLITFAISPLGNLTESLGPRVGMFDFFGEEDWALIACCLKGTRFNAVVLVGCIEDFNPMSSYLGL